MYLPQTLFKQNAISFYYRSKFNDTFGHDMGDQALRMVGSKIGRVRGGGKAFRYGGEEFTVIFPRKEIKHSISLTVSAFEKHSLHNT